MTNDDEARAQHLWESLKCDEDPVPLIAAALDEARRDTWEAAAQAYERYVRTIIPRVGNWTPPQPFAEWCRSQAQRLTPSQSQAMSRSGEEEAS